MQGKLPCAQIYGLDSGNGKFVSGADENEKQAFHCSTFKV